MIASTLYAMSDDQRPSWTAALSACSEELQSSWIEMRRHLHRHPELSGAELLTTKYLATELGKLELPVHLSGENCGVTADLITSPEAATGPRLAIRGDRSRSC